MIGFFQSFSGVCAAFCLTLVSLVLSHSSFAEEETASRKVSENVTDGEYKLVWSDEFNESGPPSPKNWVFETGFVRNNEDQWYQDGNARCKDGLLYISAREEVKRNPGYVKDSTNPKQRKFIEYTSSSMTTKGLHRWTMGRFVMRAKIPFGEGMWPAFWTIGENGEWPSSGEIDIMEYYQNKLLANVVSGTHQRWKGRWDSESITTRELGGEKWLRQFHIWRMDWDTESIRIYVDDRLLNETKLSDTHNTNLSWGPKNPFHHPHYLIINLALGGDNGGDMEKAKLPADFVIDYVRVYQRDQDRAFKPNDSSNQPVKHVGNRVGIQGFSERKKTLNKKCGWDKDSDSRSYAWKPQGSSDPAADMFTIRDDKIEGEEAYRFVLRQGWSRWVVEMNPGFNEGVADLSGFKKMGFAIKSKDAKRFDSFQVIIDDANGESFKTAVSNHGFRPDGDWHRCTIDLKDIQASGLDLKRVKTLFAISWGGGVRAGDSFKLDDLFLE